MKIANATVALLCMAAGSSQAQTYWSATNGPYGGQVMAVHAVSNTHLYAYLSDLGMMVSTDAGQTWTASGLRGYSIEKMASNRAGHVFAGSGRGGGVQVTTDNGAIWSPANTGLTNLDVTTLAIGDGDTLFAGTSGGGVFVSHNGTSWTQRNGTITGALGVYSLTIDGNGDLFAATNGGLFRSIDNGRNWTLAENGLATGAGVVQALGAGILIAGTTDGIFLTANSGGLWTQATLNVEDRDVRSLAVNGSGHGIAGTANGGVYVSTDNGNTWTPRHRGVATEIVRGIAVNSQNHIFLGSDFGGVYRSADNGMTWEARNQNLSFVVVNDFAATGSGILFAATDVGVYRTTDSGNVWVQVNTGLTETKVWTIAVGSSGNIFVGTNGRGCFRSTDGGITWDTLPSLSSGSVYNLTLNGSTLYAGTIEIGLFRSTNNGNTWDRINSGMNAAWIYGFDAGATEIYSTTVQGIYRSTDGGDNWTHRNNLFAHNILIGTGNRTFAGSVAGLDISSDQGATWTRHAALAALTGVNAMGYTAVGSLLAAGNGGVFRSTDNGDNWEDFSGGLPDSIVSTIIATASGPLYAAIYPGKVYRSSGSALGITPFTGGKQGGTDLELGNWNRSGLAKSIHFNVPVRSHVRLTIHDMGGRLAGVLLNSEVNAGEKTLFWNGSHPNGVYVVRMESAPVGNPAQRVVKTRKAVLVK